MIGRVEQSGRLRNESPPHDAVVLVRGGPHTLDKLAHHAAKTAKLWTYEGAPVEGISVFLALGDSGEHSLDSVLASMSTYRVVHLVTVGQLRARGFDLLATGRRPHFTLRSAGGGTLQIAELLAVLGAPLLNPHFELRRKS